MIKSIMTLQILAEETNNKSNMNCKSNNNVIGTDHKIKSDVLFLVLHSNSDNLGMIKLLLTEIQMK